MLRHFFPVRDQPKDGYNIEENLFGSMGREIEKVVEPEKERGQEGHTERN